MSKEGREEARAGAGWKRLFALSKAESSGSTELKKFARGSWTSGNRKTLEPQIGAGKRGFVKLLSAKIYACLRLPLVIGP